MNVINNLSYTLEINFVNKSGMNSSISIKFQDDGLKVKTVKVGNVCITEETINGRVLSGRIDNPDGYCGYVYDYKYGENVSSINPNIPIDIATPLINKTKNQPDFLTSELVFSAIVRNDYRVVILNEGDLNVVKTVSAKNENSEHCCLQEIINLSKSKGAESFIEQDKKRIYTIDSVSVADSQLRELSDIMSQSPKSCKGLIRIKNEVLQRSILDVHKAL